jgi:UDP-glucose 4-epimerase
MSILITGSQGYIGSHLRTIVDASRLDIVHGIDIKDPQLILNHETIIHLAAKVKVNESIENPWIYYDNNINGTKNLLKAFKGSHFIFASTGAVSNDLTSPYALSKKVCEDIIQEHCEKNGIEYTIFRFYNVIGGSNPTNPDGLFYALLKAKETGSIKVFGGDYNTPDGSCVRDYLHVMEVSHSIKKAIGNPSNQIESLGHGKGHTVLQIIDIFKKVNNVDFDIQIVDRRKGDLESSVLTNISKYMTHKYTIQDMLKV